MMPGICNVHSSSVVWNVYIHRYPLFLSFIFLHSFFLSFSFFSFASNFSMTQALLSVHPLLSLRLFHISFCLLLSFELPWFPFWPMYSLPFLFIIKNLFTLCHVTNHLLYIFFVFSIFLLISSHLSLFLLFLISSVLYFIPCSLILSHPSALSLIYLCICCSSLYFCLFHCLISLLVSYFLFLLFYPSSCDAFFLFFS